MGGLMVENSLPICLRDDKSSSEHQLAEKPASPQRGVTVLFERETEQNGKKVLTSAVLSSSTSIQQIKLSGPHRGWFKSGERLVLGGRELLEHELIGQLPRDSTGFLHVYVKLSDLTNMSLSTASGQSFVYSNPRSPPKSALTASLASPKCKDENKSLVVRGQVLDGDAPLESHMQQDSGAVVHLVIRRPKVEYQSSKDSFELTICSTDDVESIKKKVEAQHGLSADSHTLLWKGKRLSASKSLASYGVGGGSVLELVPIEPLDAGEVPSGSPLLSSPQHELYEGWLRARAGLAAGQTPKLAAAGTGGSYFIADSEGNNVAVFKPEDEEPLARNNPKGHSGVSTEGYRRGIHPGEGAVREVAAFLLDDEHFAGVPPTALVSCQKMAKLSPSSDVREAKIGSLQAFVASEGDCEERGAGIFGVEQVHKIAVLDIRLANCDRNGGNILIKRATQRDSCHWELVPIDHGYCLPSSFSDISFEWIYWPQAAKPFSDKTREYIARLDAEKDEQTLKAHGLVLRPECNRVRKVCTMLLKKAAAKNFTPFAIANIMCRESRQKSPLEKIHSRVVSLCATANACLQSPLNEQLYLHHMSESMDEYLDQLLLEDV